MTAVTLLILLVGAMGCTSKNTEPTQPKAAEPATGESADTENPSYAFSKKLEGVSMEEALRRVEDALQANGFGVLTKIDIQDTFKTKIDVDFRLSLLKTSSVAR